MHSSLHTSQLACKRTLTVSPAALLVPIAQALVALPLGFAWSLAERSRGATAVLAIVGLTEAFLVLRALQVWQ